MATPEEAPQKGHGYSDSALLSHIAVAIRNSREFRAMAAFGLPPDATIGCSEGIAEKVLDVLRSLKTLG